MSESVNSITFNQEKRKVAITSVAVIMAIAFFAGSGRVIKYFPGATPGGILLNASMASAASLIKDYNSEGDESCYQTIAAIGIASIVSWGLAQSIKGRVSLPLRCSLQLCALFNVVVCFCSKMFPQTYIHLEERPLGQKSKKI